MARDEDLTDDYVANLLAKDAKESSIKYSALGLAAFAPSKPPANKPKPNTRFLRNIIKDTDSHNAALLAKEAAESRARLQSLAGIERRNEKPSRVGGGDIRRRQLGDIAAILGGEPNKRRQAGRSRGYDNGTRRVNTSSEDEERQINLKDPKVPQSEKLGKEEVEKNGGDRTHRGRQKGVLEDRGKKQDGVGKRDSTLEEQYKSKDHRRKRHRSRSPREHRHRESRYRDKSPEPEKSKHKLHRSKRRRHSLEDDEFVSKRSTDKEMHDSKVDQDSDPLDDIIGPRPPPVPEVRSRGRGTISHASGIESRFSSTYDPTADVQLDPEEENDWDQAMEALRDRQRWKQQGADRLRAAGFTEDEISKWKTGGEKRGEDVKWAKHGEGREWDRGKVVDDEGIVSIEPKFGRLKDT